MPITTEVTLSLSQFLQDVVEATLSPAGHTFLTPQTIKEILHSYPNSIQVDLNQRDEKGRPAVRATPEGVSMAFGAGVEHHVEHPQTTRFNIEEGIPVPAPRRGIQLEPRYPFNLLNVGQSFMVPATPERPNPAKNLASTVSSANKRLAKDKKRFIVRPVEEKGVKGARIWRVE